jgi:hypothetical protein
MQVSCTSLDGTTENLDDHTAAYPLAVFAREEGGYTLALFVGR